MPDLDSILPFDEIALSDATETDDQSVLGSEDVDTDGREMEESEPQTPSFDPQMWERDDNPYKARFAGLQGRVQQEVETRKALEAALVAMEAEILRANIAHLPPEQQQFHWDMFVADREAQEQQRIQQEQAQVTMTVMGQLLKSAHIQKLSTQYGVPQAELNQFNNARDMEIYAQKMAEVRRSQRKTQRRQTGADTFEGGTAPGGKRRDYASLDDAAAAFAQLRIR